MQELKLNKYKILYQEFTSQQGLRLRWETVLSEKSKCVITNNGSLSGKEQSNVPVSSFTTKPQARGRIVAAGLLFFSLTGNRSPVPGLRISTVVSNLTQLYSLNTMFLMLFVYMLLSCSDCLILMAKGHSLKSLPPLGTHVHPSLDTWNKHRLRDLLIWRHWAYFQDLRESWQTERQRRTRTLTESWS